MKKWESKVITKPFAPDREVETFLNQMGQDGWQPVSIETAMTMYTVIFKREIPEPVGGAKIADIQATGEQRLTGFG